MDAITRQSMAGENHGEKRGRNVSSMGIRLTLPERDMRFKARGCQMEAHDNVDCFFTAGKSFSGREISYSVNFSSYAHSDPIRLYYSSYYKSSAKNDYI